MKNKLIKTGDIVQHKISKEKFVVVEGQSRKDHLIRVEGKDRTSSFENATAYKVINSR